MNRLIVAAIAVVIGMAGGVLLARLLPGQNQGGSVGVRGGVIQEYAKHVRCKPASAPCKVEVEVAAIPASGPYRKCEIKVPGVVMVHKGQTVEWQLAGDHPTRFEFDTGQGIDIAGNQFDDEPDGADLSPVFKGCTRSAPDKFVCTSDGTKTRAKVHGYTILLKHKASGKVCLVDPTIVNRD